MKLPPSDANFTLLPVKVGRFPDGQPNLYVPPDVLNRELPERYEVRITSPDDLLHLALFLDVVGPVQELHIRYLMGGRMDRSIGPGFPRTLRMVCHFLNFLPVSQFKVLGPHSQSTLDLLRDSDGDWEVGTVIYNDGIKICTEKAIQAGFGPNRAALVFPDAGAVKNFHEHYPEVLEGRPHQIEMAKQRDLATGQIRGHQLAQAIDAYPLPEVCIIVDDLCDGGATFTSAASSLKQLGAKFVGLVVLHGIFSKGIPIDGIDHIVTTNSFHNWTPQPGLSVVKVL